LSSGPQFAHVGILNHHVSEVPVIV